MDRKKKTRWLIILSVVLAAVLVLMVATIATAASVNPTTYPGNEPGGDLKIDPPVSGTYAIPGHAGMFITVTISADGKYVSFDSDYPVLKVYVKGGNGYNEYDYSPSGTYSDTDLRSPDNAGGIPNISHVTFVFGGTVTTTTEEETTTTVEEESSTTTTQEETTTTTEEETTTTTQEETTTTTQEETTTTTEEETTTTTEEVTTTTVEEESSTTTTEENGTTTTVGDITTVTVIQTGGGGTAGPSNSLWALGIFALALAGGLVWTALRPVIKNR